MAILLIDVNLDGHAELLAARLNTETWREWRDHFDIRILHFERVGLDRNAKDSDVWAILSGKWVLSRNGESQSQIR